MPMAFTIISSLQVSGDGLLLLVTL